MITLKNLPKVQTATVICSAKTDIDYTTLAGRKNVFLVNDAMKLHKLFDKPIGVSFHWELYEDLQAEWDGIMVMLEAHMTSHYKTQMVIGLFTGQNLCPNICRTNHWLKSDVASMFALSVEEQVASNCVHTMLNSGLLAFQLARICGADRIKAYGCRGTGNHDPRLGGVENPDPVEADTLNQQVAEHLPVEWF